MSIYSPENLKTRWDDFGWVAIMIIYSFGYCVYVIYVYARISLNILLDGK